MRQRAVILHLRPYGEADAIVTLFSENMGKVAFFARGARGAKRKETLQPFYEISLELRRREGSDLLAAHAIDIGELHLPLHAALERLAAASCVLEAYRDLFHDGDADAEAFSLLLATLSALEREPPLAVLLAFTPRFLAHIGYEREVPGDFRRLVAELESVAGHPLSAHRFFLEVG